MSGAYWSDCDISGHQCGINMTGTKRIGGHRADGAAQFDQFIEDIMAPIRASHPGVNDIDLMRAGLVPITRGGQPITSDMIDAALAQEQKERESNQKPPYALDQVGFTDRLEQVCKNTVRYCVDTKAWHICNQQDIWSQRTPQEAVKITEYLYKELLQLASDSYMHKKEYALAAVKVADYGTANKILSRLSGRKSIMANLNEFDTKDNLMAVGNGVVNLTTGELSPGKAADMHSLYTTINYNPEAQAPRWNQFLSEIFPDNPEIIAFLQRAVGMTLYGNETEVFFICYGVGANGKSVFLDVIKTILQKYADKAAISTFTGKNDDSSRARSDIVRLAGRRMIVTSENKAEVELDTGLIKEWSGDKEIVARGLYSAEVKFEPKGSIWFATNHKPIIKDDSDGTWRRCRMVPFMTTIPEERRNSKLGDELVANEAEGILAWMIAGAKEFASSGLQVPESIRAATEDYKEEQLPALQFAREMLEVAFVDTPWKDLTDAYKNWQYENDMPCSPRADAKALEKALRQISKTIQKKRITNGYVATNVQLKSM